MPVFQITLQTEVDLLICLSMVVVPPSSTSWDLGDTDLTVFFTVFYVGPEESIGLPLRRGGDLQNVFHISRLGYLPVHIYIPLVVRYYQVNHCHGRDNLQVWGLR